ncbi:MAG: hypothetical protein ABDH20_00540 [Thermus sp.]
MKKKAWLVVSESPYDEVTGTFRPTVTEVELLQEEEGMALVLWKEKAEWVPREQVLTEDEEHPHILFVPPDDPRVGLNYLAVQYLQGSLPPRVLRWVEREQLKEALRRAQKKGIGLPERIKQLACYLQGNPMALVP